MDLIAIANTILSQATHRLEVSAQNISNIQTPGYKSRALFSTYVDGGEGSRLHAWEANEPEIGIDFSEGKLQHTGAALDLSVLGKGFFVLQSQNGPVYTPTVQLRRDEDGRLLTPEGFPLQTRGGDAVVGTGDFAVANDGTV